MKKNNAGHFYHRLFVKNPHFPLNGQIELTYRCNLNCVHCYSNGLKISEITTAEWKIILDILQKEGCLNLTFTGGEPLVREDFLEIYSYAKAKGFLITIFTNAQALSAKLVSYLLKSPPLSIEITLNGIAQDTYESITRVPRSFFKVMKAIRLMKQRKLPFILKTNCLKQNKQEIGRIKAFTERLFVKLPRNKYRFKYDPFVFPRFSRDKAPCNCRLSFKELAGLRKQDADIWGEYQKGLHSGFPDLERDRNSLYLCDSWRQNFFISPGGYLRFCHLSDKFGVDLKEASFKEGFYKVFPQLLNEKFKTSSKCRNCNLRPICYYCPARAYLETGNEEAPVPYYCRMAKANYREIEKANEDAALQ